MTSAVSFSYHRYAHGSIYQWSIELEWRKNSMYKAYLPLKMYQIKIIPVRFIFVEKQSG